MQKSHQLFFKPRKQNMNNDLQNDYQALRAAAVTLGTKMMATLSQEQLEHMAQCTQRGAKLMLELEMPNCKEVSLVLRELEGRRTPVLKLQHAPGIVD